MFKTIIIALLIMYAVYLLARIIISWQAYASLDAHVDTQKVWICRDCMHKRFSNSWMGMRVKRGVCNYCHKTKNVDQYPMGMLRRK